MIIVLQILLAAFVSSIALGGPKYHPFWTSAVRTLGDDRFDSAQSVAVLRKVMELYPDEGNSAQVQLSKISRQ